MSNRSKRVFLASISKPENVTACNGTLDWDSKSERLRVETASDCWSYAVRVRFPQWDGCCSYTRYLIRIHIETVVGEVGVSVLGEDWSDLQGEVLVSAGSGPRYIEIGVPKIDRTRGIIVRNGSKPNGNSVAEIDSIEVFGLPETEICRDLVIADFIEMCRAAPDASAVVSPGLDVNVSPCTWRIVRLGPGQPLSVAALQSIVKAAEHGGYAITSGTKVHGTVLAVIQSRAASLPLDPREWPAALLENSESRHQEMVAAQYSDYLAALDESMHAELSDFVRPLQKSVIFELANACNLACPFCPRNGRKIKDGIMKAEDAKRVIRDIAQSSSERIIFYPHYLGETMIHPAIFDIIDHALSFPNIDVHCISNGILLDERRREELLKRRIDNYNFSIHECDQVDQEGVPSEEALSTRNVLAFLRQLSDSGARESTYVSVSMVPSSFQDSAIIPFRDYWLGVANQVTFYACVALDRTIPDRTAIRPSLRLPCSAPWREPVVAYDGSVLPCCWDYEHTMVMGNVFEERFEEIWSGDKFRSLRKAILQNDFSQHPTCANCEKWQQWVPALPQIRLPEFYYTSNGTYRAYGALELSSDLLDRRLATLPAVPRWKHLPIYRKPKNYEPDIAASKNPVVLQ